LTTFRPSVQSSSILVFTTLYKLRPHFFISVASVCTMIGLLGHEYMITYLLTYLLTYLPYSIVKRQQFCSFWHLFFCYFLFLIRFWQSLHISPYYLVGLFCRQSRIIFSKTSNEYTEYSVRLNLSVTITITGERNTYFWNMTLYIIE